MKNIAFQVEVNKEFSILYTTLNDIFIYLNLVEEENIVFYTKLSLFGEMHHVEVNKESPVPAKYIFPKKEKETLSSLFRPKYMIKT
jgi:hypothetical protein